jgi:hypothetical protein
MGETTFQTSLVVEDGGYRPTCTCGWKAPHATAIPEALELGQEHADSHPTAPVGSTVPLDLWRRGPTKTEWELAAGHLARLADALEAIAFWIASADVEVRGRERAT